MKILHVVPTYLPAWRHGGPIRAVHGLARALVARGDQVTVFTTDLHGSETLDVPREVAVDRDGVAVHYFPARWGRLAWAPTMKRALLRISEFDLVHLHSVFLWPTLAAARAAERAGVPYVLAPRGMLVPELIEARGALRKSLWIRWFERRTIERAAALHATANLEAEDAQRLGERFGFQLPPTIVVPNGVEAESWGGSAADLSALSPAVRTVITGGPFVLALGRVSWKKGLGELIQALAEVPPISPDLSHEPVTLAIAGNDEEGLTPRLIRLAEDLGLVTRVAFLGPVDGADRAALLTRCALLAMPSRSENFGNSLLEAMAAGRPVVTTPGVGLAAEITRATAGLVVDGDPASLGGAIHQILSDGARAVAMGERGRALALGEYGWPRIAERMSQVYAELIAARGKGSR